eukprot:TRINITY_DN2511_c0_g2_i3.p1 TRINITY_DN2511_c0_g2~~TRINITY_DN2511_c0_g2_i3.p1  ORF type:complete len:222 (-),score=51.79 TRINITY_DN2511_c0_g2_i3:90-755(-)
MESELQLSIGEKKYQKWIGSAKIVATGSSQNFNFVILSSSLILWKIVKGIGVKPKRMKMLFQVSHEDLNVSNQLDGKVTVSSSRGEGGKEMVLQFVNTYDASFFLTNLEKAKEGPNITAPGESNLPVSTREAKQRVTIYAPTLPPSPLSTSQVSRPEWLQDCDVHSCMLCSVQFSFFIRRHHCRCCGKIFCSACCNQQMVLPHLDYSSPQPVCITCFKTNQ